MFGIGMQELLVILAIALVLFGGKKLPEIGQNLGKAIRGFKDSTEASDKEAERRLRPDSEPAQTANEAQTEERKPAGDPPSEQKKS